MLFYAETMVRLNCEELVDIYDRYSLLAKLAS